MKSFPSAILSGLVIALLAPARAAQDLEAAITAALERTSAPADVAPASDELARLGPEALPALFERLQQSETLGPLRTAALIGAFAQLPRDEVIVFLHDQVRTANERQREAGLDLLAQVGTRKDLELTLALGTLRDPAASPGRALREAFESALLALCERDPETTKALAASFPRVAPAAQASLALAVARGAGPEAAGLLAAQLESAGKDADALLLFELGRITRCSGAGDDLLVGDRVRKLLDHSDAGVRVLACLALGNLRDHQSVPDLIALIGDDDSNLARAAHSALTSLTGLALPAEQEVWTGWLDAGVAWWDERAELCREALVSGTTTEAAAALHEIARQRLYPDQLASLLALALERTEPDILKITCRALGALPERTAFDALFALTTHEDPTIVEQARAALERLEAARPCSRSDTVRSRTRKSYEP